MKINYTITGSLTVDETVYKEAFEEKNKGKSWSDLSAEEKKDFIKSVEKDTAYGYDGIIECASADSKVVIEVEVEL